MNKATPTVSWAAPAPITYGTALGSTQLNAAASYNGSAVAGTFAYTPVFGTVLGAGSQALSVTFTPTDTTDYSTATATVQLTVNPASQTITFNAPQSSVTYGVAPITLSATGGGSGNPVIFTASPSNICTTTGGSLLSVVGVGAGLCTINRTVWQCELLRCDGSNSVRLSGSSQVDGSSQ